MDIFTNERVDFFQRKVNPLSNFCSISRKAQWAYLLVLWVSCFFHQATAQCTAAVTSVTGGSVGLPGGVVNLSAVGTGSLHWYDALTEGNRVNIGPTYSPTITATTHYFVESVAPTGPNGTATPPAQSSSFSSNIRGYWFTSPADILITSVYVPTDASTGNQNIAVVKFNGAIPPPLFSATTNDFTTLFLTQNNPESGSIPVEIVIHAGDVIGILGARANTTSYSPSGQSMTIAGTSVALARLGMQFPLSSTMPQDLWTENGGSIGRVQFDYTPVCFSTPRIQVTATLDCTPQVSITADPSGPVTAGTTITFTATPVNAGAAPTYQWKKNNQNVGTDSPTYIDNAPLPGDKIICVITGNEECALPNNTATSNEITLCVTPTVYNVTGGGFYCGVGSGVTIGLSGSQIGVNYQLKEGANTIGPPVAGTGSTFNFPLQTTVGTYTVVAASSGCMTSTAMAGSAVISTYSKPTVTLNIFEQTFSEGSTTELCDIDSNPTNNALVFNVTTACTGGSLVWRTQIGAGAWSSWSASSPSTQPSDNQLYHYQAACDAECPASYTSAIELKINYRASTPQNVSLVADGTTVAAGESKTICNIEGNAITFTATCGEGEILLYSVDAGSFSNVIPSQIVDDNSHTYRVRCRKADNTPSCVETESTTMSLKISVAPTVYNVTGGGFYCGSGPGVTIGLSGSQTGVSYQLKQGLNNIGLPVAGTGSAFSFPLQTTAGTYTVVAASNECMSTATMSGSAVLSIYGKPTVTLSVHGQTFLEGNQAELCDIDANPSNNTLVFNVTAACAAGSLVWRTQIGAGVWSSWSANAPGTQPSDNQLYRYQAACDANCPATYTSSFELKINYRASSPENVSLTADGTAIAAGESKTICDAAGNTIAFNATCAPGEILLYAVDGGEYSAAVPAQIVDGNFHNYRVRCRKADNTPSCVETESATMSLKITTAPATPTATISPLSTCEIAVPFSGNSTCAASATLWYNAANDQLLASLPATTPNVTSSFYARCRNEAGCLSEKSNIVTFTLLSVNNPPVITVSSEAVCTGTPITVSANCPAGSAAVWNTGITQNSFEVTFTNVSRQAYSAKCVFANGCQSPVSALKEVIWKAFDLTVINIGQSQSGIKPGANVPKSAWAANFVTPDAGPSLEKSTQLTPTMYYTENLNKGAPRYWTIQVETCALGTDGSVTYDMLASPETGVAQSFNTHENNAPYLMYANREGFTELYAQNHPAYGFYQDNGSGGNVYDAGLPKGLYKLSVRYWDQKGQGSIYPSTRQPAGNVLAYQEYWFRIQSKDGIGTGSVRASAATDNGQRITDNGSFAQVMPNPVSNTLRLKVNDAKDQKVNISLMDVSGRTLLQRAFVPQTNQHQEQVEVSDLANGMYFLRVNTAEKHTTLKVVKVQ